VAILSRPPRRIALLGATVAAATLASAAPADAAVAPKLSCKIAKALKRVPAKPVWFPVPQPPDTTLTVNGAAPPKFARGLKWSVDTRYLWLGRYPRGAKVADPKAKLVFSARFANLGRTITVLRRRDGRLFTQWKTSGKGRDTTVVVSKDITSTELGEFVASLRKVRYPAGC
jgi:hypothetical protein